MKILSILPVGMVLLMQSARGQEPVIPEKLETDNSSMIELLCKLDAGSDVRYTVDIANNILYRTIVLENGLDGVPITISEREIRHELRVNEKLVSLITIDRFTLAYRAYTPLMQAYTKDNDGWISGQCETLERLF